jgi:hypothetical protein
MESDYNPPIDYEGRSELSQRELAMLMVARSDLELISRKKHGDDFQVSVKPLMLMSEADSQEDDSDNDSDNASDIDSNSLSVEADRQSPYESDRDADYRMSPGSVTYYPRGRFGMEYIILP